VSKAFAVASEDQRVDRERTSAVRQAQGVPDLGVDALGGDIVLVRFGVLAGHREQVAALELEVGSSVTWGLSVERERDRRERVCDASTMSQRDCSLLEGAASYAIVATPFGLLDRGIEIGERILGIANACERISEGHQRPGLAFLLAGPSEPGDRLAEMFERIGLSAELVPEGCGSRRRRFEHSGKVVEEATRLGAQRQCPSVGGIHVVLAQGREQGRGLLGNEGWIALDPVGEVVEQPEDLLLLGLVQGRLRSRGYAGAGLTGRLGRVGAPRLPSPRSTSPGRSRVAPLSDGYPGIPPTTGTRSLPH
jgi:hypothetical protein